MYRSIYIVLKFLVVILLVVVVSGCSNHTPINNNYKRDSIKFVSLNTNLSIVSEYDINFNNGVNLAVSEINKNGGIKGKKIVINQKDPQDNYSSARSIVYNASKTKDVLAIFGSYFTPAANGASRAAGDYSIPFLASSSYTDDIIYKYPNDYTYRLRPGLQELLSAVAKKAVDINGLNRWLVITYSNSEGSYVSKTFEQQIIKANGYEPQKKGFFSWFHSKPKYKSGLLFNYHYVAPFKAAEYINVDTTLDKDLEVSKSVLIVVNGADLQDLIDNANLKKRLMGKQVFVLFAGEPEWFDYTSDDKTPENWLTTGYPWYNIHSNAHDDFYFKYWNIYELQPRYASVLGYISVYMLANAAKNINLDNPDINQVRKELNIALSKSVTDTPLGKISMLPDHQTDMGIYMGQMFIFRQRIQSGRGQGAVLQDTRMKNIHLYQAKDLKIPIAESLKMRHKQQKSNEQYDQEQEDKSTNRTRERFNTSSYTGKW
ncbi:ABC transporter substrate-binding protein [Rickettsiales bacterium LUAb2]